MIASIMLTATQARSKAQNDLVIFNEVRNIELAILTASAAGLYDLILNSTTMTSSTIYCNVWKGVTADRAKEVQMAAIVKYFTDLGYSIERKTNSTTGTTFDWQVYW
jgi:hypothetical protein